MINIFNYLINFFNFAVDIINFEFNIVNVNNALLKEVLKYEEKVIRQMSSMWREISSK